MKTCERCGQPVRGKSNHCQPCNRTIDRVIAEGDHGMTNRELATMFDLTVDAVKKRRARYAENKNRPCCVMDGCALPALHGQAQCRLHQPRINWKKCALDAERRLAALVAAKEEETGR